MIPRPVCIALLLISIAGAVEAAPPSFRIGPAGDFNSPGKARVSDEAQKLAGKALAAFRKGDLAAAKKDFQKVLVIAPDNVATLINLGLIAYHQKQYAEAEQILERAVRTEPHAGLGWLLLGVVRHDADKLDAALAALAQAAHLEPKDARAHHYLGVTIGRKGWYLGAEEEMRRAIELNPDYVEAHFNLAVFYMQRVPPAVELARRHYHRALDLGAAPDADLERSIAAPDVQKK